MQNELNHFEPFVSANEAWEKLKPSLDQEQKKKRRIIWWWFTSIMIAIGIGGGLFLYTIEEKQTAGIFTKNEKEIKNINKNNKIIQEKQPTVATSNPSISKNTNLNSANNYANAKKVTSKKADKTSIQKKQSLTKVNTSSILENKVAIVKDNSFTTSTPNNELNTKNLGSLNLEKENEKIIASTAPQVKKQQTLVENALQTIANKTYSQNNKVMKDINENKGWQYGLQWNIPISENVNFLNKSRTNNPANLFIPTVYFKKPFGNRSSVEFYVNPYSTHYISNKTVMQQNSYQTSLIQGSRIINNTYTETNAANKLISTELGLFYGYNLNKHLMLRAGISHNWSNWAMVNSTIVKNGTEIMIDTLYSITKSNGLWQSINPTFMLGKLDLLYSFNKLEVGLNFSTPLKPLTNLPNDNTPINANLFMRWRIK